MEGGNAKDLVVADSRGTVSTTSVVGFHKAKRWKGVKILTPCEISWLFCGEVRFRFELSHISLSPSYQSLKARYSDMKFSIAVLALASTCVYAGRPQIKVRDGNFEGLDELDPSVSWEGASSSGDFDLTYGVEVSAQPTKDVASLPRNIWGKATTNVAGWG
eukprot:scaffold22604_cov130-Cylindrotheca_fusiformis.AAC.17